MQIKVFLIGIILFSLIVTAFAYIAAVESNYYTINITEGWNDTYSKLTPMYEEAKSYRGETTAEEESGTNIGTGLTRLVSAAGSVLLLPWRAFDFVFGNDGVVEQFAMDYGVPTFLIHGFIAIAVIALVFAVVSAVLRWRV